MNGRTAIGLIQFCERVMKSAKKFGSSALRPKGEGILRVSDAMMNREIVSVETPEGPFSATLIRGSGISQPGLVMIPEIFGINASLLVMAENFADAGFSVLILDIFWRQQPNVNLSYAPEDFVIARRLHSNFDYDPGVRDMQAGIDLLRKHPSCSGKIGVVGYCLGGTMAYLAAARTDVDASVGYYGTRIDSFLEDGPKISRPLILHLGRLDHRTPPPVINAIQSAVGDNAKFEIFVYENAKHGFANHTRSNVYDADATRLANERTVRFFHEQLS